MKILSRLNNTVFASSTLTLAWHLLAPESWRWLDPTRYPNPIYSLWGIYLTSGLFSVIFGLISDLIDDHNQTKKGD